MAILPLAAKEQDIPTIQDGIRWAARRAGLKMRLHDTYSGEGDDAAAVEGKGIIQEPCRCPFFPDLEPGRFDVDFPSEVFPRECLKPAANVASCFGSIKIPGKSYRALRATYKGGEAVLDSSGEPTGKYRARGDLMTDAEGNALYLKARIPRTGSNRLVLRNGDDSRYPVFWIYKDGSTFDNEQDILPCKPASHQHGWATDGLWETTTDVKLAQLDYDYAVCYGLDWAELLIEGDKVVYHERTSEFTAPVVKSDGTFETDPDDPTGYKMQKVSVRYYEVEPLDEFLTVVEGQAKVQLLWITPKFKEIEVEPDDGEDGEEGEDKPSEMVVTDEIECYEVEDKDNESTYKPPEEPVFEVVHLKFTKTTVEIGDSDPPSTQEISSRSVPDYHKTQGICNDCTIPRVRGVFVRTDVKQRRYPMLFEVPTLRVGGAIRSRQADCFYKLEHDSCAPKGVQPEMKLIRHTDGWRLIMSPDVCAITCTELNDKTGSDG